MGLEVFEADLPSAWATALINGDFSCEDLSFEDRVQILHFQKTHGLCCAQSMSDEEVKLGYSTYYWLVDEHWKSPVVASHR